MSGETASGDRGESGELSGVSGTTTSTGIDENVAGALCYLFGFVTGLIFYLVEEDSEFVRFHAAQSMVVFGALAVLSILTSIFTTFLSILFLGDPIGFSLFAALVSLLISLAWLVVGVLAFGLWLYLMLRAYQGRRVRVPFAANIADRWATRNGGAGA